MLLFTRNHLQVIAVPEDYKHEHEYEQERIPR